jgi:hypothetical protein
MAWVAISSGVTGRWGDIEGVWIDPVMAQVMMVFDFLRKMASLAAWRPKLAALHRPVTRKFAQGAHASLPQVPETNVKPLHPYGPFECL